MRNVYPVCCGLDIHASSIVACVRDEQPNQREPNYHHHTFGTDPADLVALNERLDELGCQRVAMESTGVYWKPVYQALFEAGRDVLVVNPARIKQIPGFKTDRADAQRISDLLAADLLPRSFILDPETEKMRELMRMRTKYVKGRTKVYNQMVRWLEFHGIKLKRIVSQIRSKVALSMLHAIAGGCDDPDALAAMRVPRMKASYGEIKRAMENVRRVDAKARLELEMFLEDLAHLERQLAKVHDYLAPHVEQRLEQLELLQGIPGFGQIVAMTVVSEIGTQPHRSFASSKRLTSWAGVCPGNHESAGKRFSGKACRGNRYLKRVLVEAAWSLKNDLGYFGRRFRALAARIGHKKAAVAIAHKLLVVAYQVLATGQPYCESRLATPDPKAEERRMRRYVNRLHRLGYEVTITPKSA